MEQLVEYNLLFRWFVGLSMDDVVWDATVFRKNRDRLLDGDIARKFMTSVLNLPQVRGLLRRAEYAPSGLSHQHDQAKADRGAVRLVEKSRRLPQDQAPWTRLG